MVKNGHVLVDNFFVESIILIFIVICYYDCSMFITLVSVVIINANYPLVRLY